MSVGADHERHLQGRRFGHHPLRVRHRVADGFLDQFVDRHRHVILVRRQLGHGLIPLHPHALGRQGFLQGALESVLRQHDQRGDPVVRLGQRDLRPRAALVKQTDRADRIRLGQDFVQQAQGPQQPQRSPVQRQSIAVDARPGHLVDDLDLDAALRQSQPRKQTHRTSTDYEHFRILPSSHRGTSIEELFGNHGDSSILYSARAMSTAEHRASRPIRVFAWS